MPQVGQFSSAVDSREQSPTSGMSAHPSHAYLRAVWRPSFAAEGQPVTHDRDALVLSPHDKIDGNTCVVGRL